VYNVAHRIKPSIDLMGVTLLRDCIRFIEKQSKENNDSEDLKRQISYLHLILNKVIASLRNHIS